ncbi:protein phosphatase 2C domain-containing protein [Streptomyces sp. NPDC001070]
MSQQGETDRRQEDEWWGQLYGQPDPGDREPGDTLDDRYSSAVSALGGERDGGDTVPAQATPQDAPPAAGAAPAPDGSGSEDARPGITPSDNAPSGTTIPDTAAPDEAGPDDSGPPDTLRLRHPAAPPATAPRPWQYQGPPHPRAFEPASEPPGLPPGWAPADRPAGPEAPPLPPEATVTVTDATYIGDGPPTYDPEPTAWPLADPADLDDLVPDTVLDGARYGLLTVRTASVRGDSARYRGEPRRDAVLTARFGAGDDALLLIAVATGPRTSDAAHRAARDACTWIAAAVGRSQARLSEDIRTSRRGSLKSGLHRLTDRCYGRLRARGEDLGLDPAEYSAGLRCLLLPVDPDCRIRLFFGVGDGGLFRIRGGEWQDLDPWRPDERAETEDSPAVRFRFRASVARSGDTLLLCSGGLAGPLRGEPALAARLVRRWGAAEPPGLPAFLGDTQTRVKGYADDRTAVAVWDA